MQRLKYVVINETELQRLQDKMNGFAHEGYSIVKGGVTPLFVIMETSIDNSFLISERKRCFNIVDRMLNPTVSQREELMEAFVIPNEQT